MSIINFVCVNFNNSTYTEKLCKSLDAQLGRGFEFSIRCIVVDNSTDNQDADKLMRYCGAIDWVVYIRSPVNVGYFGGLNRGLIETKGSKYVVIGNNDLEFQPDFCSKLVNKIYKHNQLVICPDIITPDGVHQNPHVLKRTNWWRRFKFDMYFAHYSMAVILSYISGLYKERVNTRKTTDTACEISMGAGACYILTRRFLDKIDSLYFPWFLYGEEACLSWQVRESGGIMWFDPELVVKHAEKATCSKLPSRVAYGFGREAYWQYRSLL